MTRVRRDDPRGQGLLLRNLPADTERFIDLLMNHGCHPAGCRRILARIARSGYDRLTVQATLDFAAIQAGLARLGVAMEFIDPQDDWAQLYPADPFPAGFVPPHRRH